MFLRKLTFFFSQTRRQSNTRRLITACRLGLPLTATLAIAPLPALAWQALGSGMDSTVNALSVDASGDLYAGGAFTTAGGLAASRIAKWDGTAWSALGSGINSTVSALTIDASGNLYAGGSFITAGGVAASRIAKWDGTTWSALGSGVDNTVSALTKDATGNLYAGGAFTTAGGLAASRIAKWDGTTWSALGSGANGTVNSLTVSATGNLYAGGGFTTAGGITANRIAKWDGTTWSALGSGPSTVGNGVVSLATDASGKIYAGSNNPTITSRAPLGQWDGTSWSSILSVARSVFALSFDASGNLYAGGNFSSSNPNLSTLGKWNGTTWSTPSRGVSATVNALTVDANGNLYAGGAFTFAGGVAASRIAVYVSQNLTANQWHMFSLPHVPVSGVTLQSTSLFGDNFTPADYDSTWVVYERDETTKAYRKLALTDPLVQGKGYWIKSTTAATLDMDGLATPVVSQATNPNCTSSKGCYEVTLTTPVNAEAHRYNLVGFPFFRPTSWANVRFEVDGTAYTPTAAQAANFAANTLWKYNGSGYQTYDDNALTGSLGTLSKMEGFWVKLLPGSTSKTVKLLLPLS